MKATCDLGFGERLNLEQSHEIARVSSLEKTWN